MPPKVKKETEDLLVVVDSDKKTKTSLVPVFNLDNLNPALLPELATFKEKQLKVVEDNPFVKITDTASRDLAKKYRTARVSARTALQAQDKLISSKFNEAKTRAKSYIGELIDITLPGETEQQIEIDRDEAELEAKRQEKARLEKLRIDNIKAELDRYSDEWKVAFNLMTFDTIENVGANFYESYTTFDTTILQEFDSLFPTKIEELTKLLEEKTASLTEAENARLEKERIDLELKRTKELITAGFSFDGNNYFVSDFKRLDMGTILQLSDSDFNEIIEAGKTELARLAKIETDKAEKAEEEKEAIYEIRKKRLEEAGMIYSDEHDSLWIEEDADYILLAEDVSEYSALEFEKTFSEVKTIIQNFKESKAIEPIVMVDGYSTSETNPIVSPEIQYGVDMEEKALELLQNIDSSVPENTTANVCTSLEEEIAPGIVRGRIFTGNVETTPVTTWESIFEEFTTSGGKSFSKWLKDNYNPPTKIQ